MANDTNLTSKQFIATTLGSAISGMLARIPTHPIDTCKARLQANSYSNLSSTASSTLSSFSSSSSATNPRTSGSSSLPSSPSTTSLPYRNTFQTITAIIRNEGIRGLYRGFGIAFIGSGPAACLYFTSYEISKRWLTSVNTRTIPNTQHPQQQQQQSVLPASLIHLCSGILAETCSCILWVPIDVIKERMQVQGSSSNRPHQQQSHPTNNTTNPVFYRNTSDALRKILRYEGIRGIYRGYGATLASFGPFSALYFVFYEAFKTRTLTFLNTSSSPTTLHELPLFWQILTAMTAGATASLLTNPLDLVKLRLQVQRQQSSLASVTVSSTVSSTYHYNGMIDGMKDILRKEGGIKGLFRGAGARVAFHAPSTAISMTLFEQCRSFVERSLLT